MNDVRRKRIAQAVDLLNEAMEILDEVKDEEQEAFDNLPENFQAAERGEEMEGYVESLAEAYDYVESAVGAVEEI